MKSIGIEVSKNGVSLVEVSLEKNSYRVLSFAHHPYTPQEDSDWLIESLQTIKSWAQDYDLENTPVVIGLPQSSVSSRHIEFPFTKRLDIVKSLPFELEEELPLNLDVSVFDYKLLAASDTQSHVLAFALHQEEVMELLENFQKVQLDPAIVSLEGAAFANLFENPVEGSVVSGDLPEKVELRVFMRYEKTLLAAFDGPQMLWCRSMSFGEKDLYDAVSKTLGTHPSEVQKMYPEGTGLLIVPVGSTEEQVLMSETMKRALVPFLQRLKMSMVDLQDQFEISKVSFVGDLARVTNVTAFATQTLGTPISVHSWDESSLSKQAVSKLEGQIQPFTISLGLAIEGLKRGKNLPINFRQGELAKNSAFIAKTWSKWGYAITMGALLYVLTIGYGITRNSVAAQLDDDSYALMSTQAQKIAGLKGKNATLGKINRFITNKQKQKETRKIFEGVKDLPPVADIVDRLSSHLPSSKRSSYDVRALEVDYKSLTIQGVARNQKTILDIQKKLKSFTNAQSVKKITPTIPKESKPLFAFRVQLKE